MTVTIGAVGLDEVAAELYALRPEEFTAARNERARQERDKEQARAIRGLRRPTASAWAVNLMSRQRGDELGRLGRLGGALRAAQGRGSGEELRQLGGQRHEVVSALVEQARTLAADEGQRLSAQALGEVEATFEAALADPDAAEAVGSGRLTGPLRYAGFGPVDLSGAVAAPAGPEQAVGAAGDARAGVRESRAALEEAEREVERARGRRDEVRGKVEKAAAALAEAEHDQAAAAAALREAEQARLALTRRRHPTGS